MDGAMEINVFSAALGIVGTLGASGLVLYIRSIKEDTKTMLRSMESLSESFFEFKESCHERHIKIAEAISKHEQSIDDIGDRVSRLNGVRLGAT